MTTRGLLPPAEATLLAVCSALWLVAGLSALGVLPAAGLLALDLYSLYSFATVCGWLAGNVYVRRRRLLETLRFRKLLTLTYVLGPPSLLVFLRALAPVELQGAAPLVPLYSLAVYLIFFLVPVTLKQPGKA